MSKFQYFFTTFGVIYSGWRFHELKLPEYTIIIQSSKLNEYNQLSYEEKNIEKIKKYGWVLKNEVVIKIIDGDKFQPPSKTKNEYQGFNNNIEHKTMFIFGAGASANCVYGNEKTEFENDSLRPPLGIDLFDKRFNSYINNYPGASQSLSSFLSFEKLNIEELFEQEWDNIQIENNLIVLNRHINLQYYLQDILKDASNRVLTEYNRQNLYAIFANKLQKYYAANFRVNNGNIISKNFAFVSFNQDSILESFLTKQFNIKLNQLTDFIKVNENPFSIFKPHGSWNWGWKFPNTSSFQGNTSNWLFENKINLNKIYFELLGNLNNMVDNKSWGYESSLHEHNLGYHTIDKSQIQIIKNESLENYFPSLLLPYRDKDEFIMPLDHFDCMQQFISNVENIVIIGWKGNEKLFNNLLFNEAKKTKKVIIVDPNPKIVEEYLEPLLSKKGIIKINYLDFYDFVVNGLDNEIFEF